MTAFYQKELDFLFNVLAKMRLNARLYRPGDPTGELDLGLRSMLGLDEDYERVFRSVVHLMEHKKVYKMVDQFLCRFIYFRLPHTDDDSMVVIGPYLTADLSRESILEQTERLGLSMDFVSQQTAYYASLPVFIDPSTVLAIVSAFGETIWGGSGSFDVIDVAYEQQHSVPMARNEDAPIEQQDILQQMKQMEERYAFENELMEIVMHGQTHRAEVLMSGISQLNYQPRSADPLRNIKNYCIICNTLLRKAAEQGGVHPIHLDSQSGHYARLIENVPTLQAGNELIGEMLRAYCRLVRTHAGDQFSPVVQRIRAYIDANLSGDLTLNTLADLMRISPGYLSTIFRRETGKTLIEYVIGQRMKAAIHLLQSTGLQIQTISQLCGCADPNYFSRLFKRHYGMTPGEFRRNQASHGNQS
ncbi:MAG: helix-turn-helix transcriptional regulator [Clostridia bacterium]|nr:helix-turn-helix transcriptional regulator [Clostridia bacterium]